MKKARLSSGFSRKKKCPTFYSRLRLGRNIIATLAGSAARSYAWACKRQVKVRKISCLGFALLIPQNRYLCFMKTAQLILLAISVISGCLFIFSLFRPTEKKGHGHTLDGKSEYINTYFNHTGLATDPGFMNPEERKYYDQWKQRD